MIKKFLISIFLLSFSISVFACWGEQCTCKQSIIYSGNISEDSFETLKKTINNLTYMSINNKKYYKFITNGNQGIKTSNIEINNRNI